MNRLSVGSVLAVPLALTVCAGGLCAAFAFVDAGDSCPAELGAQMLRAARAKVVRWIAPRTAAAMLLMNGGPTVSYDDVMRIMHVHCN